MFQNSETALVRILRWVALLASFAAFSLIFCDSALAASATVTTLNPATSTVLNNQSILLKVNVTSGGQPVPSGPVQFCDVNVKLCFGAGLLGQAQLSSSGTAQIKLVLPGGTHSVKAVYNGTSTYAASSSTPAAITVGNPAASLTINASGSTGNYSFTSSVTGQGSQPLTGKVSIINVSTGGTVLGTAAVGASTFSQSFQSAGLISTANSPAYLVAGDFDGDGFPDIAVTSDYNNSVTVLFNLGDFPRFTYQFSGNVGPEGLAVGDFNDDGLPDFAVAENNNSAVQIFLNQGNGTFSPGELVSAGFGPDVLAVGDFNRDGQLDIAVVNQENSTVTILLGQGNGSFTALSQTAAIGYFATGITTGDFNGDGILDLAVCNFYDNTATVLLGNGDGTFRASTLNTGTYPVAIVAGDLNNDGKLDLVVANQFSQNFSVFLGDGAGNFALQASSPSFGPYVQFAALGDFNQDGKLDAVVTSGNSNTIHIMNGNGDGTLGAPMTISLGSVATSPNQVLATDFNGDGTPDLMVAEVAANGAELFLNDLNSTATANLSGINVLGAPGEFVAASYSGDTYRSAGVSNELSVNSTPFTTTTTVSAESTTIGVGETVQITGILTPGSYGTLLANGAVTLLDGTTTVATGQYSAGVVAFNEHFSAAGTHAFSLVSAATPGFLASKSGAVTVTVVADSTSTTTLTSSATSVAHGSIVALTAAVTSGGKPVTQGTVDFCNAAAAVCEDSNLLRAVQLNTSGIAVLKLAFPIGSHSIKAKFVGTGLIKTSSSASQTVAVTGQYSPTIAAKASGTPGNYTISFNENMGSWQSLPTTYQEGPVNLIDTSNKNLQLGQLVNYPAQSPFVTSGSIAAGISPVVSTTGDFNNDGKMDLAFASSTSGTLTIQLGNGNGTFTQVASTITLANISALVAGDFNGDGKLDLAAVDSAHNLVTVALGNGNGTFTTKGTFATGACPSAIAMGDFNNDGILDLAVVNSTSSNLTILLGKGDGSFTADPAAPAGLSTPTAITAADFNGDGNLDLAVSNSANGTISVLAGKGDGAFTSSTITLGANSKPGALAALDFNQDGKPDLAVALQGSQEVLVLINDGNQTFTGQAGSYLSNSTVNNMVAADFNGDGLTDIVLTDVEGNLFIYYNHGGQYLNNVSNPSEANKVGFVSVGDFDNDGGPDLAVSMPATGSAAVELQRVVFNSSFINVSIPGTGTHTIILSSPAVAVYTAANSNPLALAAQPVPASVILQPGSNSTVLVGQTVSLTARVLSVDNFEPTGTVSIYNGPTLVKTSALTGNEAVSSINFTTAGTYSLTATYNGDANLLAASSPATPLHVLPATATSKTTLSLSATTATLGTPVTLTVSTLTAANAPVTAGVINFCDASAKFCDNASLLGTAQLTGNGTASIKLTLSAGTHQIKAVFPGTQTLLGSTSATSTLVVTGLAATATQLTSSGSAGDYSLIARVTGLSALPLSGSVTFHDATTNTTLGTASLGTATTTIAFNPTSLTLSGSSASVLVAGDFNNDGKQDFAVLDLTNGVTIYLGNGAGGFTAKSTITLGFGGETLVTGDFNDDGKLDLAVTGFDSVLSILMGNGDGTFNTSNTNLGQTEIYALAVADINHDGKLDLIGTVSNSQTSPGLGVLLGNGDGTFNYSMVPINATSNVTQLAVADFNGDGNPDVAVANFAGGLLLFFGDGAGGFTLDSSNYLPSEGSFGIVSADFNGDGKPDLAVANFYSSTVTILLGNGDGTFTVEPAKSTVKGTYEVAAGDFNLDGKTDLVVVSDMVPEVSILLGNGSGGSSLQTIALPTGSIQYGIGVADWNSDGRPDILLPNENGQSGSMLYNASTESASATLSGVVVGGTSSQGVSATYGGSTSYAGSTSNTLTLAPDLP